jgi:osmotically-inducible protein OsmY
MKKLTILLSASVFALMTTGCTTALTAGVKKGDERNFARSLNDITATRAIAARMSRVEGFQLAGVDIEVAEGIAVLSGNVPREEDRVEAERIAWSGPTVIQVGNEILIKQKQGLVRNTKDGVLNNSVRARMIATKAVKARNYSVEVNDGVVYLLGVARTPEELALAAQIASTTKGTVEVISYVRVAGDNSRMTATGPGFNGEPSTNAGLPNYAPLTQAPISLTPTPYAQGVELPSLPTEPSTLLDNDAIESGEPYYRDLVTGERITLPEGVTPIPYVPENGTPALGSNPGTKNGTYNIDPQTGNMVPASSKGE